MQGLAIPSRYYQHQHLLLLWSVMAVMILHVQIKIPIRVMIKKATNLPPQLRRRRNNGKTEWWYNEEE
jgi:hypothetical protein